MEELPLLSYNKMTAAKGNHKYPLPFQCWPIYYQLTRCSASLDIYGNITLQQIIDERITFLKEQINRNNKTEANSTPNSTFQLQIDAIRSVDDIELIEPMILQKKGSIEEQ